MELYRKVRLACRDGMSERAAARHFGVSRQSVRKMLQFSVPPGYRRTAPVRRPKLDEFTGLIEQWLEDDGRHGYRAPHWIQHIVADQLQQSPDHGLVRMNLGARYAACTVQFSPRMSAAILSAMRAADSCTESRARCAYRAVVSTLR